MLISVSMDRTICLYNTNNFSLLYKYFTIGSYTLSIDYNSLTDVYYIILKSNVIGCGDKTMLLWNNDNSNKLIWRTIKV